MPYSANGAGGVKFDHIQPKQHQSHVKAVQAGFFVQKGQAMGKINDLMRQAKGLWYDYLVGEGIDLPPIGKNGTCPICGGSDRFVFSDKRTGGGTGDGTWFCRTCGTGDGLNLLSKALKLSPSEALRIAANSFGIGHAMSATEQAHKAAQADQRRSLAKARAEREAKRAGAAAERAAALTSLMISEAVEVEAAEVPYLAKKALGGFSVRVLARDYQHQYGGKVITYPAGGLLVPIGGCGGFTTAEIITADRKTVIAGGIKSGGYAVIEPLATRGGTRFCVVEGYATGLSVRQLAKGSALVVCAMSKSGLEAAAQALRKAYPSAAVVICADTDAQAEAQAAAQKIGATVAIPTGFNDWDDYRQAWQKKKKHNDR
jgi:putative DNA primase/helicase